MRDGLILRYRRIIPLAALLALLTPALLSHADPPEAESKTAAPAEAQEEPIQPESKEKSPSPAPEPAQPDSRAGTDWTALAPGLWQTTLAHESGDVFRLQAFRISLEHFDIQAADARSFGEGVKHVTVDEAATSSGAVLAVNGSFFDEHHRPLGMVISRGERINPFRQADWGVLYVRQGQAQLVHTRDWAENPVTDAWFAIQVGPRLVVGGKPTSLKPQVARRAAIGILAGRQELVVAVTDLGRAKAEDLAALMARPVAEGGLGCVEAVAMDGGPSSQLYLHSGSHRLFVRGLYPVPISVVFVPKTAPSDTP